MPNLRIGIALNSLRKTVRSALQSASRAGAEGVEFDLRNDLPASELSPSAVRQLRKLLEDLRLTPASAAYPTRHGFGDPAQLDRRIAGASAAIQAAAQLGARRMVLRPGPIPAADAPEMGPLVDALTMVVRQGEHYGVRVALLPPTESLERLPGLLGQLPSQAAGSCLDPADVVAGGGSPGEALSVLGPTLAHLYAADAVRDLSTRSAVPVELGRGSVDWPEMLAHLEEHEYRGWAMLKLREGGALEELANAAAYLRATC